MINFVLQFRTEIFERRITLLREQLESYFQLLDDQSQMSNIETYLNLFWYILNSTSFNNLKLLLDNT